MQPDKRLAPRMVVDSLLLYLSDGVPTGGFLRSVLANDLMEAVGLADCDNLEALPHIVSWVYSHVPLLARGSYEKVDAWLKAIADKRNASKPAEEVPGA